MIMLTIFKDHYNEITQAERDIITATDLHTAENLKFETVQDFKEWAKDIMADSLDLISEEETEEEATRLYSFYEYEIEMTETAIFGRVEIQTANENAAALERIYNYFDDLGTFELYLDSGDRFTWLDITTYGSPDGLPEILEEVKDKLLEVVGDD